MVAAGNIDTGQVKRYGRLGNRPGCHDSDLEFFQFESRLWGVGKNYTIDKHQRTMYIVGLGVYPCQTFGTKPLHNLCRKYYEPLAAQPLEYRSACVQR